MGPSPKKLKPLRAKTMTASKQTLDNESSDSVNDNEPPDSVNSKVETPKGSTDIPWCTLRGANNGNNDNESSDSVKDNEPLDSVISKVETQQGFSDTRLDAF